MNSISDQPLVTLCLVAYKQEDYIREAVQSALAQTYQPLEIIFSDDCSPDGTFEIIKEEAENYRGPHRLIVHQTQANAGVVNNLSEAWKLANGEFIVAQAGDDISLPQRVAMLVQAWREPSPVDLVVSDVCVIDKAGREVRTGWPDPVSAPLTLDEAVAKGSCYVLGCAVGYSKELITAFGPIDRDVIQEDWVMSFRALTARGIRVVKEPLLKYREHGNNVWFGQGTTKAAPNRAQARRFALNRVAIHREWIKAWERSGRPNDLNRRRLAALERQWRYDLACYDSNRLGGLWLACHGMLEGLSVRNALALIKRHVFRWSSGGTLLAHR